MVQLEAISRMNTVNGTIIIGQISLSDILGTGPYMAL